MLELRLSVPWFVTDPVVVASVDEMAFSVAPDWIVRLFTFAVAGSDGELGVPDGMRTSSVDCGTPPDQFPAVDQADDTEPVHVLKPCTTVTALDALCPPFAAVIVALPAATPNTTPFALTVAILASLVVQDTGAHPVRDAFAPSLGEAASLNRWPVPVVVLDGASTTLETT